MFSRILSKRILFFFLYSSSVYSFFKFYFIFKLYKIVLVLPNIKMNHFKNNSKSNHPSPIALHNYRPWKITVPKRFVGFPGGSEGKENPYYPAVTSHFHFPSLRIYLFWKFLILYVGLPRWLSGKESACQHKRHGSHPWVEMIPWRRKWQPTPAFLPGKSHGQRSLVGYSPWDHKELDTNEQLTQKGHNLT